MEKNPASYAASSWADRRVVKILLYTKMLIQFWLHPRIPSSNVKFLAPLLNVLPPFFYV